jgi:hypothetical protein
MMNNAREFALAMAAAAKEVKETVGIDSNNINEIYTKHGVGPYDPQREDYVDEGCTCTLEILAQGGHISEFCPLCRTSMEESLRLDALEQVDSVEDEEAAFEAAFEAEMSRLEDQGYANQIDWQEVAEEVERKFN